MKQIVFASQNENKVNEIRSQLKGKFKLLSLNDIGYTKELREDQDSLRGNALQKARFVYDILGYDCFADDTGLEVDALGGKPGVYSARYAGAEKSSEANMNKLLAELKGKQNRKANFRTAIALLLQGEEYFFEGICQGKIIEEKKGEQGFGYDPVFMPNGYEKTFAEMKLEEKAGIGHRGKAVKKLINFLAVL